MFCEMSFFSYKLACYINYIFYCGQQSWKAIVLVALDGIGSFQITSRLFLKFIEALSFLGCKVFVFISNLDEKCVFV